MAGATPRSYKRTLQVSYPGGHGELVLRIELDWGSSLGGLFPSIPPGNYPEVFGGAI